ncbi:MAG: ornithine cyclodeaminase family protein, partial [Burkholderiales bacterium]
DGTILILSDGEMARLIDWPSAFEATKAACRRFSAGVAHSPNRLRIPLEEGRRFAVMPSADLGAGARGAKLIGYYPDNPARGLARVTGIYTLFDPVTGLLLALMEGAYLTNVRTAAGAVVAAEVLARSGWRRLGVIGSGGLGTMAAEAFLAARPAEIRLFSRTAVNLDRLIRVLEGQLASRPGGDIPRIIRCDTPEDVAGNSDVLVCATDTKTPVFDGTVLTQGQLVISLGANTPTTRELDLPTMRVGRVIADSRSAVLAECGEILIPQRECQLPADPVFGELGEILNGTKMGRQSDSETLVFLSTGLAVQDVLTAQQIYHRALAQGIGTRAALFDSK